MVCNYDKQDSHIWKVPNIPIHRSTERSIVFACRQFREKHEHRICHGRRKGRKKAYRFMHETAEYMKTELKFHAHCKLSGKKKRSMRIIKA
jgi:hypothetical protein